MNNTYVSNGASWHILVTWTRVPRSALAVCGRTISEAESRDTLPAGKTCETCFRSQASRQQTEDDPETWPEDPVM